MKRLSLLWCVIALVVFFAGPAVRCVQADDTGVEIISVDEERLEKKETPRGPVPVNRILAVVDDQVITMADYRAEYGDTVLTYGRLNPLIDRLVLLAEARDREITPPKDRLDHLVERQIKRINRQTGGLSALLRRRGLTEEQFRDQLRRRIKTQVLESRVLSRVFPQLQNGDTQPAYVSVRARLMLVDDLAEAWRVYGWLQSQPTEKTWNRLYGRYSRKLSLMGDYGDLGWFNWGQFNQKVEYRIYKLPLYAVSKPFPLRDGYALVYPTGYRLDPTIPNPSQSQRVYAQYRRRYFTEKLYERLRHRQSVVIPTSIKDRLDA